jgi:ATP-binding cassette subfamily C (CFTR/MRP) protein 10
MQVSFNVYDTWLNSFLNGDPIFMLDDNFLATIVVITLLDVLVKIMRATSFAYGNLVQASSIFSKLIKRVIFGPAGFFDLEDSG